LAGTVLWHGFARAQAAGGDEGESYLPAKDLTSEERIRFNVLREGSRAVGPGDKPILDKAAEWYINRVTWPKYQNRELEDKSTISSGRTVYDILEKDLYPLILIQDPKKPPLRDTQVKFMEEFTKSLLGPINKILRNPEPIARINAGLILLRLSETGQEDVAAVLAGVLEDPKQLDAVKFYALQGLKTMFRLKNAPDAYTFTDKDLETRCILALDQFLKRPANWPKDATPAEIDAFRYVRREAVRALGQTRFPAIVEKREVKARPALDLLEVIRKDGVNPEPSVSEQLEAAIALCQLRPKESPTYNVDLAVHAIAQFLVDYADRYEKERTKGQRSGSWRYDSARVIQALQTLRDNAPADAKTVGEFVPLGTNVYRSILAGNPASDLGRLRIWLDQHKPQDNLLFRGDAKSAVQLSQAQG
jgi:hypothetical protein